MKAAADSSLDSKVVASAAKKMARRAAAASTLEAGTTAPGTTAPGAEGQQSATSTIKMLTYKTQKRPKTDAGNEDWEPFTTLSIGSEFAKMLRPVVSDTILTSSRR